MLELFQADGDPAWLAWARELQAQQDALFWDAEDGGWFSTTGSDPSVLLRLKEDYDGAEPSASSVSVLNLLTLAHLVDDGEARQKVERTLGRYGERAGRAARVIPMMLAGLSAWHAGATQIVVLGDDERRGAASRGDRAALPAVRADGARDAGRRQQDAGGGDAVRRADAVRRTGRATAFVCRDFACREPVTTAEALAAQLQPAMSASGPPRLQPRADTRAAFRLFHPKGNIVTAEMIARAGAGARDDSRENPAPEARHDRRGGRRLQLRREHPRTRARRDRPGAAGSARADLRAARSARS